MQIRYKCILIIYVLAFAKFLLLGTGSKISTQPQHLDLGALKCGTSFVTLTQCINHFISF